MEERDFWDLTRDVGDDEGDEEGVNEKQSQSHCGFWVFEKFWDQRKSTSIFSSRAFGMSRSWVFHCHGFFFLNFGLNLCLPFLFFVVDRGERYWTIGVSGNKRRKWTVKKLFSNKVGLIVAVWLVWMWCVMCNELGVGYGLVPFDRSRGSFLVSWSGCLG